MTRSHVVTFVIMFAFGFLSLVEVYKGELLVAMAYASAFASWVVVACYEYNERVFNRAIQEIVSRYAARKTEE